MVGLRLDNVSKSFGDAQVIDSISFEASDGEFVVFVGPSGCGKSTLLRLITGLEEVSSGRIHIGGADVTAMKPSRRSVAMVFQSYALFPHMTVAENIGFGLRLARLPRDEISKRVAEAARILQVEDLLDRKPRQLSGGQRQRVAIGRSIIRDPKVFLFDEPLSNLDAALRVQMRLELARLHQRLGTTMIYVTHDQTEAMTLADRIVVMSKGRIEQVGSPIDLYEQPANRFVAGFLGSPAMNFLEVRYDGTGESAEFAAGSLRVEAPAGMQKKAVAIGIRPEHVELAKGNADDGSFPAKVEIVEKLGAESLVYLQTDASSSSITMRTSPEEQLRAGDEVRVCLNGQRVHYFDVDGRALIRTQTEAAE